LAAAIPELSRIERRDRAAILRMGDEADAWISDQKFGDYALAVVGRAIVDDDDLGGPHGLCLQRRHRLGQQVSVIVVRDDGANGRYLPGRNS
jgi:hypothetical protein